MAYYAALVSLVQLLKDITLHDRYSNTSLNKRVHVSLYEKFKLLQKRLDDYSPKVHIEESNGILERRIRDAAYRAQYMIESRLSTVWAAHIHLEKSTSGVERLRRHLGSTFQKPLDFIAEKKYHQDLEKVKADVDSILEQLTRIKVESNTVHEGLQPKPYISAEASSIQAPSGKNTKLVFNEDLKTAIKAQLCGESSKLEIISIAGMGGLGKTTLARNVFDDRLIHDRFDSRAWVTVSQDYHLETVLLAIVNSLNINKEGLDGVGVSVLQQHLYKYLFGRRYVIVMDDVWEARFWDDIRRIFPNNLNGSRLMITTRLSTVADYASGSKFHHQMKFLDEDQSWTLLQEKVFAAPEHCPEELEVIGKKIAKNCGGLPLAIVLIGGVLSNVKRAKHDWQNIARKVSSTAIDQNNEHLLAILSMSYNHLPHHLKPCFLYLGGFPEDYEICISKLIRLWVAEGFLKPIESKSLEEVGEEYMKDLVNRNLVLITRKKSNGKFKSCIIHDVLRDLCSQRARDENFLFCVQREKDFKRVPIENVGRVYIQKWGEYSDTLKYMKIHGSNVRSLIYCPRDYSEHSKECVSLSDASGCKLLRILGTRVHIFSGNSAKLKELLHLRYLKLWTPGTRLPSQIHYPQNLQTLSIIACENLPFDIWKMRQLRHLEVQNGVILHPIPDKHRIIDGVPLLGSLQTLCRVVHFSFTSDAIKMIPNIKKLGFKGGHPVEQCWEFFDLSNLVHLHQLETLFIEFNISRCDAIIPLPENFAFPSTLVKLTLEGCRLPWKDMSAVGSLPNLQVLKLRSFSFFGKEWEPIEGEFLKLKFLKMNSLVYLKYWQAENTHFPCLEQLRIRKCNGLKEIPPGIGDIPTLQLIELDFGHSFINSDLESSALEILQQQRDLGNDDLQVHVFPSQRFRD